MVNIQEIRVRQKFSMKSLTFSCLICALKLHLLKLKLLMIRKAKFARGC